MNGNEAIGNECVSLAHAVEIAVEGQAFALDLLRDFEVSYSQSLAQMKIQKDLSALQNVDKAIQMVADVQSLITCIGNLLPDGAHISKRQLVENLKLEYFHDRFELNSLRDSNISGSSVDLF